MDPVELKLGALCGLVAVQRPLAVLVARQHANLPDGQRYARIEYALIADPWRADCSIECRRCIEGSSWHKGRRVLTKVRHERLPLAVCCGSGTGSLEGLYSDREQLDKCGMFHTTSAACDLAR